MEVSGRYESGRVAVAAEASTPNGARTNGAQRSKVAPSQGTARLLHQLEESRRILSGVAGSVSDELRRQRDLE
jgi:hypothetical protein